jgi:hypothetical protein
MKIKITLLILLGSFIISKSSYAQLLGAANSRYSEYQWHISVGAEGLLNSSPGSSYYSPGIGGTVRLQYDLTQNVGLTATTGYYLLPGKSSAPIAAQPDLKLIPFKLGAKAYFTPNWFLMGEVGLASARPYLNVQSRSKFSKIIAPAIGYETSRLETSLAFMNVHHKGDYVSNIVLRVAYNFNF